MKSKITVFLLFFLCFAIVISTQVKGNQYRYKSKVFKMNVLHKLWRISAQQVPHESGAIIDAVNAQWTDCKIVVTVYNGVHISFLDFH